MLYQIVKVKSGGFRVVRYFRFKKVRFRSIEIEEAFNPFHGILTDFRVKGRKSNGFKADIGQILDVLFDQAIIEPQNLIIRNILAPFDFIFRTLTDHVGNMSILLLCKKIGPFMTQFAEDILEENEVRHFVTVDIFEDGARCGHFPLSGQGVKETKT